jgi:hypothetical protein
LQVNGILCNNEKLTAGFVTVHGFKVHGSKVVFTANLPAKVARLPKFYGGQVRRAGSQSSIL